MSTIIILSTALSLLASGLFSGLMFSLVFLMQSKWNRLSAPEYVTDIQPFLRVAKGNRAVTILLLVSLIAPIVTLIDGSTTAVPVSALLILIGLIVFGVGVLGVTVLLNLPTYTALMSLNAQSPGNNWSELRRRFYHLNLIRFLASTAAFLLFVAAMMA